MALTPLASSAVPPPRDASRRRCDESRALLGLAEALLLAVERDCPRKPVAISILAGCLG